MSKFFIYSQNMVDGRYIVNQQIGHHVVIEASDSTRANMRASRIGLIFDEHYPGEGWRWTRADAYDGFSPDTIEGHVRALARNHRTPIAIVYTLDSETPIRLEGNYEISTFALYGADEIIPF